LRAIGAAVAAVEFEKRLKRPDHLPVDGIGAGEIRLEGDEANKRGMSVRDDELGGNSEREGEIIGPE
jgi:hypothetical protein